MTDQSELDAFVRGTFHSIWALELLLLLKSEPGRSWGHADMVREMRGSDLAITGALGALVSAGLVRAEPDGAGCYRPQTPELARLADEIEAAYARSPARIRRLIVRSASPGLAAFSDAFRLRKD